MGVGLDVDALDTATINEIVDVGAAPGDLEVLVDHGRIQLKLAGALIVDVDVELEGVVLGIGAHVVEQWALPRLLHDRGHVLHELLVAVAHYILHVNVKA